MQGRREELNDQIQKLKEIREMAGMNRTQFSEYIGIPRRTLEEWEGGRRKAPDYVINLINYKVYMEHVIRGRDIACKERLGE